MAKTKYSLVGAGKSSPGMLLCMAAIGLSVGVAQSAFSEEAPIAQPQQIFQDQQNRDPFSSRGNDQVGGVMDLVHRVQQAGSISREDFVSEQQENLDSATAAFRAAQQKRLMGTPTAPTKSPNTPSPTN